MANRYEHEKNIYRKIAKMHGVTVAELKKDMQAAIDYAYTKTDKSDCEKSMQESMPYMGEVPTTNEFIKFVACRVKKEMAKK